MDNQKALNILFECVKSVSLNWDQHALVSEALQVLQKLIDYDKEKNEPVAKEEHPS